MSVLLGACALFYAGALAGQARGHMASRTMGSASVGNSPTTLAALISGPAWTYSGGQQDERAGSSLAILGDMNGDGYGDALVGSPGHEALVIDAGRVDLFIGTATGPAPVSSWAYVGEAVEEQIGAAVAAAGDVNGDGYADALVGAAGATGQGVLRAFYGSALGFPSTPSWVAAGEQAGSGFGSVLAGVGDTNGDGYSDVLVGAPAFDGAEQDQGRVYLYLGSATGLGSTPVWSAEGEQLGMMFGSSLTAAGDVNGDGFGDIAIGAWSFDTSVVDTGKVVLYLGAFGGPSGIPSWSQEGSQAGERLGSAIATAGDADGDGFSDLVVGAEKHSQAASEEGAVMMFRGSAQGLAESADWVLLGGQPSTRFGAAIAGAGDVNNDGLGDIIVGAPRFPNNGVLSGRAFLFLGNPSGQATAPSWIAQGFQELSGYGQSLAGAGDLNGDGYCDLLVGAPQHDNDVQRSNEGRSYAYLGGAEGPRGVASTVIDEEQPNSALGASVCDAGDANGDGFNDILAGAYEYSDTLAEAGKAYLFLGSEDGLLQAPAWTVEGTQGCLELGRAVASAGDVNGDGYGDIIVGAAYYDGSFLNEGAAYVFYGSPTGPAAAASWMAQGHQEEAQFGWCVAGAGDVNGDGFGDVVVGADQYTTGESVEGRAFLYLGSSHGLSAAPAWTFDGNQEGAGLGGLVAGAGDMNGDGYGDVLVDAYGYDVTGVDESRGRLYLFCGGASGLQATPSWIRDGDRVANNFGYTAGKAGDVNGDGYSDIIMGSLGYEPCRAYVYHGSPAGPSLDPDWTFLSDQENTGLHVSTAGDLNADGYCDIVLGLANYTNSLVGQGRTYLFFGSASGVQTTPAWTSEGSSEEAYFGIAVSNGGDINGDGYGDVVIGANGSISVFHGNGGTSPSFTASQRRSAGGPLDLLGRSDRLDGFTISATYNPPQLNYPALSGAEIFGWLEWEVAPLGTQFDGIPERRGAAELLSSGPNVFEEQVDGLFADVLYSWRARAVTNSPMLPPTAWFSIQGRAASEPELRVGLRRVRPAGR